MTYPVNSDGPRKPIDSLAEQVRREKKNTTLPPMVEPSRAGTPSEGDRISQDSLSLVLTAGNTLLREIKKEVEKQKHENKKIDRIIWRQR